MAILWIIPALLVIGAALYLLLPALVCTFDKRLAGAILRWQDSAGYQAKAGRFLGVLRKPRQWQRKLASRLLRAGYQAPQALPIYLFLQAGPVILILAAGLLTRNTPGLSWLAGLILASLVNHHVGHRIRLRQQAFVKALYKIYRFLDLQLTAGVRVTDALLGLPEAVHDPVIHPVLVRFSAHFELTLDLDLAFGELRQAFGGSDCEMLATHMRQCLQTGLAGRSLIRMEELLFTRFFGLMQQETGRIRNRLLLTAILGITPAVILYLYPLLYEATQALQSIFG